MRPLPTLLLLPLLTLPLGAQARPALSHYNVEGGLAIEGYDPVAYFPIGGGKPARGKEDFSLAYRGVTYRFATDANRRTFQANPERYEPEYGGWCAYAMAKTGDKVAVDPESFLVQNGRLLLFYDGFFNDTRKRWKEEGPSELEPLADERWLSVSGERSARDTRYFQLTDGVALGGHDPVAYFAPGMPRATPGRQDLAFEYMGVTYRFASEASLAAFRATPARYEPAYGGNGAWAMAKGVTSAVDFDAFLVSNGTLYLFSSPEKRDEWKASETDLRTRADRQWKALLAK